MDGIETLGAIEAATAMRHGAFTAREYASKLLARAGELANLGAMITIDEAAVLAAADAADATRASGATLGVLHGVPVAIKDNIDVAGLPATAGTPALRNNRPKADGVVVAALRAQGAIVLGKANMHELAAGVTTDNAAFGRAHNPYDTGRVPGGSSGGTAAAVAARLTPLGLGTDTGASNRVPAAFCGVFGFRPTPLRWSQRGLIMNSPTRDTIGPMARNMADILLVDGIVTGDHSPPAPITLKGLRLGVPRNPFWADLDDAVARIAEAILVRLADAGAILVEVDLAAVQPLAEVALPIAMAEHRPALNAYLAETGAGFDADAVFAAVASPDVRSFLDLNLHATDDEYRHAMTITRPALQNQFQSCLDDKDLAAIIFPTSPILAPRFEDANEIRHKGETHSTLWLTVRNTNAGSIAGIPGLSLPAGTTPTGLPVGIEIDGRIGDDRRLLAIGAAMEPLLPPTPAPAL